MKRTAIVIALVALLGAAPTASAQLGWSGPIHLGTAANGYEYPQYTDALTMTADGAAIALWERQGNGLQLTVRQPSGTTTTETLPVSSAEVTADGLGNAFLAYRLNQEGDVGFRVRPEGGGFGPEEVLPLGAGERAPQVVASPNGDVALVWAQGGSIRAALRPRDGSFGPTQTLGTLGVGYWMNELDAALSANGDLVVAAASFADVDDPPAVIWAAARSASGDVQAGTLSDGTRTGATPSVGIDDSGRAIVVWAEKVNNTVRQIFTAQRNPGSGFGGRARLARTRTGGATSAAMSRSGRYTLSTPSRMGRRIYGGRAGEAPRIVRSYYDNGGWGQTPLASSPSGEHLLLTTFPNFHGAIAARRSGDAAFEPMQDLRHDCAGETIVFTAVGEDGRPAALLHDANRGVWLVLGTDTAPMQRCFPTDAYNPNPYLDDPYVPKPPNYDLGEGGGAWEPAGPSPGGPPAPPPGAIRMGLPSIQAASNRTTFPSTVVVVCGTSCTIAASVTLRFQGGDVLGRAKTKRSASGKPTIVEIPIRLDAKAAKRARQAMRKRGKQPLLLEFKVTASGKKLAKSTRTVTTAVSP